MLQVQRFDPDTAKLEGEPRPTGEKVLYDMSIWKLVFDASESGVMAYQLGEKAGGGQLRWFDRSGRELESVGTPSFQGEVQLSPDGKKIATGIGEVGYSNLWIYDLPRRVRIPITFSKLDHGSPIWTADGRRLIFASKRKYYSLAEIDSSGAGSEKLLLDRGTDIWPLDLSRDGRFLIYGQGIQIGRTKSQLWIYPTTGKEQPFRLFTGDSVETDGQFSPDGRWVAYVSNESGQQQVYLVSFHGTSGSQSPSIVRQKLQVSVGGGQAPRWRRDGKELFYLAADHMLTSVPVAYKASEVELGAARPLFRVNPGFLYLSYNVSPDGNRFIVNTAPQEKAAPITLVQNWRSDFR
jgi:Tol biopolymer transport system component